MFDWTPCTLEAEDDAFCFEENCEYAFTGDFCMEPLPLELNVNADAYFEEMHPFAFVPESCAGKSMYGKDVFFLVSFPEEGWFQFNAVPHNGIDIGLAAWSECSVDADKCLNGVDAAAAGQGENIVIQVTEPSSRILQVIIIADDESERTQASDVSLIVSEYQASDGDEELQSEVDSNEYEIFYDYEIELSETFENDGDIDMDSEFPTEEEMESEVLTEGESLGDIDMTESGSEWQADWDLSEINAEVPTGENESELQMSDSGSGCSQYSETSINAGIMAMFILLLTFTRRRHAR